MPLTLTCVGISGLAFLISLFNLSFFCFCQVGLHGLTLQSLDQPGYFSSFLLLSSATQGERQAFVWYLSSLNVIYCLF